MPRVKKEPVKQIDSLCFEEALAKLELIVKQLELGELPLEESLTQFADGVALSQACLSKLNSADKQIDKILQHEQGELIEKPLDLLEDIKC